MSATTSRLFLFAAFCLGVMTATGAAAQERQTLWHGGVERSYFIAVPPAAAFPPGGVPLVVVLHGAGGNGPNIMNMTGFDDKAIEEGFIAVFPEGTTRNVFVGDNLFLTWNAGHCCGYGMKDEADDIGFLTALIDTIVATYRVDPTRIYLSGMSNGGMMAHRLAIELSDRIAAIGTVVGAMFGDEFPPRSPVSAVIINGAEDDLVPVEGGDLGVRFFRNAWDGTPLAPSEFQAEFWAGINGCLQKPGTIEVKPAYTLQRYSCPIGVGVEYYVVEDNGHAWPGNVRIGGEATGAFDATDVIWDFFQEHPLVEFDPEADQETGPEEASLGP